MTENYRKVILDASALLALLNEENGWEKVKQVVPKAIMSSVNATEVVKYLIINRKIPIEDIK